MFDNRIIINGELFHYEDNKVISKGINIKADSKTLRKMLKELRKVMHVYFYGHMWIRKIYIDNIRVNKKSITLLHGDWLKLTHKEITTPEDKKALRMFKIDNLISNV